MGCRASGHRIGLILAALAWAAGCREVSVVLHPSTTDGSVVQGTTPERTSDSTQDGSPESTPVALPDTTTPDTPDALPDTTPDAAVESAPDAAVESAPDAAVESARGALYARYDFSGDGTRIVDRTGSADGIAVGGAVLDGAGGITLDGQDDFIDLPNGLVSGLNVATLMAWFEWHGGVCWQRIFDFGSSDQGEGRVGRGVTSMFLTPRTCGRYGRMGAAALVELGASSYGVNLREPLPSDRLMHVALAIAPPDNELRLYIDGELRAEAQLPVAFSQLNDVNVWLGRSQWTQDYNLAGRYEEFRIYDRALTSEEIEQAFTDGPDQP